MTWISATAIGHEATLERRDGSAEWIGIAPITFDVSGAATFTDHGVVPGHRYDYRIGILDGGTTVYTEPATVTMPPVSEFALLGARPNPIVGAFAVAFVLPNAQPARIEVFDVRGRRCFARDVGSLGAGRHSIAVKASLRPGVYLVRLTRDGASRTDRAVVLGSP